MEFTNEGIYRPGGDDRQGNYWWVFALVIVFFALIFWNRKESNGYENMLPAMAMGGAAYGRSNNLSNEIWDVERDQMREFCNIRQELKETGWQVQKENAHYFYEQQKTNLLGFKDTEILGMRNTAEIKKEIGELKSQIANDRMRSLEIENSQYKTVLGIRGYGAIPSYDVCPPIGPYGGYNHGYSHGYY